MDTTVYGTAETIGQQTLSWLQRTWPWFLAGLSILAIIFLIGWVVTAFRASKLADELKLAKNATPPPAAYKRRPAQSNYGSDSDDPDRLLRAAVSQ